MQKVVFDTNIFISAILFGGKPEKIKKLSKEKEIELLISEAILKEIAEVLRKKFNWQSWQRISMGIRSIFHFTMIDKR